VPGKLPYTADMLSRSPSTSDQNDVRLQEEAEAMMEISIALVVLKTIFSRFKIPETVVSDTVTMAHNIPHKNSLSLQF
jgi:hypothetical protein